MSILDKSAFLAAVSRPDIQTKDVAVPELGGSVRVREMTGSVRNQMEAAYATVKAGGKSKALDQVTAEILAVCVIDENGQPFMTTSDAKRLIAGRPRVAFRLRDAVISISATDDDDEDALVEVFGDAQSDGSTSD